MVVDGRTELASPDIELARLLLRTGKPLLLAVNKVGHAAARAYAEEFRRLGIKELFPISAENGNGIAELLEHVFSVMPPQRETGRDRAREEPQAADFGRSADERPRFRTTARDATKSVETAPKRDQGRHHRPAQRRQVNAC